jgi:hypothetical protein
MGARNERVRHCGNIISAHIVAKNLAFVDNDIFGLDRRNFAEQFGPTCPFRRGI